MGNIYFELTEEFNDAGLVALLASGQAVVFHRLAIMSKDGDWILRETQGACHRVLEVLSARGARYRPGAPLHPAWLAGGWSSHFQFHDERGRRVRCDFVSRPPRIDSAEALFERAVGEGGLRVLDRESLIRIKQTQRAKDYPVIGELARQLPPEREISWTTDPDRVLALAVAHGATSERESVQRARAGEGREAVVVALARETDALQRADAARLARYERAAAGYLAAFREAGLGERTLPGAHEEVVALAEQLLPKEV